MTFSCILMELRHNYFETIVTFIGNVFPPVSCDGFVDPRRDLMIDLVTL